MKFPIPAWQALEPPAFYRWILLHETSQVSAFSREGKHTQREGRVAEGVRRERQECFLLAHEHLWTLLGWKFSREFMLFGSTVESCNYSLNLCRRQRPHLTCSVGSSSKWTGSLQSTLWRWSFCPVTRTLYKFTKHLLRSMWGRQWQTQVQLNVQFHRTKSKKINRIWWIFRCLWFFQSRSHGGATNKSKGRSNDWLAPFGT